MLALALCLSIARNAADSSVKSLRFSEDLKFSFASQPSTTTSSPGSVRRIKLAILESARSEQRNSQQSKANLGEKKCLPTLMKLSGLVTRRPGKAVRGVELLSPARTNPSCGTVDLDVDQTSQLIRDTKKEICAPCHAYETTNIPTARLDSGS